MNGSRARPDDAELVARILNGETSLFAEIVRRYQDPVYGTARALCGREEAEDAAQEVFLRAYRGLAGFKGRAKLSTWLYRIAFNACTDRLRSRKPTDRNTEELDMNKHAAADGSGPEDLAVAADERRAVRRAVNGLREIYRTVVILQYYRGMPPETISEVLGVPQKTVETRLYRARKALRESLSPRRQYAGAMRRARPARTGSRRTSCATVP
jgi:RNA polymerase sigma-70 factor (ECF subfamily)